MHLPGRVAASLCMCKYPVFGRHVANVFNEKHETPLNRTSHKNNLTQTKTNKNISRKKY